MHQAITEEFRVLQTGDHTENPSLFWIGEIGLETDDVVIVTELGVLTELDDRKGARAIRFLQANRF